MLMRPGACCSTWAVTFPPLPLYYAVQPAAEARHGVLEDFQREVQLLKACIDPSIVRFLGASLSRDFTMLVRSSQPDAACTTPPLPRCCSPCAEPAAMMPRDLLPCAAGH